MLSGLALATKKMRVREIMVTLGGGLVRVLFIKWEGR